MSERRSHRPLALGLAALALAAGACTSSTTSGAPDVRAPGPPHVRPRVVSRHARQFDRELARRGAGSQQEEAAAVYILGHLQRAGYVARLEAVPVADTVNSTDVIALPPGDGGPAAVVAVAYDTGEALAPTGDEIGLFLELARALAVAEPRHSVEFAALGAERTSLRGGHLGSRRLADLLVDEGHEPLVVTIEALEGGANARFGAFGRAATRLRAVADRLGIPPLRHPPGGPAAQGDLAERMRIFADAGIDYAGAAGGIDETARVLLEFLSS
jgi:hypothetical protein